MTHIIRREIAIETALAPCEQRVSELFLRDALAVGHEAHKSVACVMPGHGPFLVHVQPGVDVFQESGRIVVEC